MRVLPILFNTDMVRAILDGRKTVTRRVIKPRYKDGESGWRINRRVVDNMVTGLEYIDENECGTDRYIQPPYQPGDILYVRETWSEWTDGYVYKAWNEPFLQPGRMSIMKWHPSIHMPKEAARIWLKVTDVRVERIKDITDDEAHREGFTSREAFISTFLKMYPDCTDDSWVWVIKFERCEKLEVDG